MPFSEDYATNILNYMMAKVKTLSAPSIVYIGLSTNDPEEDNGKFTELSVAGNYGYSRVLISRYDDNLFTVMGQYKPEGASKADPRTFTNLKQINWTKASSDWPRINGFGLFSSEAAITPFFYGSLDLTPEVKEAGGLLVREGEVALFEPNTFKISLSDKDANA